jgi:hypothetical protein
LPVLDPWLRYEFVFLIREKGSEREDVTGVKIIQLFFLRIGKDVVLVKVFLG